MSDGRVLLIEDDLPSRSMLSRGLQRLGYTVEALPDAIAAQERIAAGSGGGAFDAVVVDLRMPRMDGLQFVTWLEGSDPTLGCLLLSAQQEEAMEDHAVHPTLLFRMHKPVSFPVLDEAVAKVVGFTRARRLAGARMGAAS